MITRLRNNFPQHSIIKEDSETLFVVDHKSLEKGGMVQIHNVDPEVSHVYIHNPRKIPIYFDGFPDNAFEISVGNYCKQCECIIFPQSSQPEDWILVIETKYPYTIEIAFDKEIDYPNCMVTQIIESVKFLRGLGVIPVSKTVKALVSFPTLIQDFSGFFFNNTPNIEDILIDYGIIIRASNAATIKSNRKLYLGEIKDI